MFRPLKVFIRVLMNVQVGLHINLRNRISSRTPNECIVWLQTRAIKAKTGQDGSSAEMVAKALTNALSKFREKGKGNPALELKVQELARKASRLQYQGDKPVSQETVTLCHHE